jgi:ATP synthase protein I
LYRGFDQLVQHIAQGAQLQKPPLKRIFAVEAIVLLAISVTALIVIDNIAAYSVLLGGLIAVIPSAYFAYCAFRFSGAHAASNVARSFYRGETGKFILTTLMFAAVFALVKPLAVVVVFLIYIFMMALNWILALRYLRY